ITSGSSTTTAAAIIGSRTCMGKLCTICWRRPVACRAACCSQLARCHAKACKGAGGIHTFCTFCTLLPGLHPSARFAPFCQVCTLLPGLHPLHLPLRQNKSRRKQRPRRAFEPWTGGKLAKTGWVFSRFG